ncbi:hypothetical protein ACQPXH_00960 [Nocardia sp. CA-135953]|uniref:hypothetical protein n=1 Tax=Nocardia sp. CA-135953 TaxID=3239978 RepID=UPI003D954FBA
MFVRCFWPCIIGRVDHQQSPTSQAAIRALGRGSRPRACAAVDLIADDRRKARIVTVEAQLNPALLMRRAEVMRSFAGIMMAVCAEQIGADIVESAGDQAEFAATQLLGGLWETTDSWLAGTLAISRDTLIDRSTDQFLLTAPHLIESMLS